MRRGQVGHNRGEASQEPRKFEGARGDARGARARAAGLSSVPPYKRIREHSSGEGRAKIRWEMRYRAVRARCGWERAGWQRVLRVRCGVGVGAAIDQRSHCVGSVGGGDSLWGSALGGLGGALAPGCCRAQAATPAGATPCLARYSVSTFLVLALQGCGGRVQGRAGQAGGRVRGGAHAAGEQRWAGWLASCARGIPAAGERWQAGAALHRRREGWLAHPSVSEPSTRAPSL